MVWTTPLVATLGMSLTIPLAMVADMMIHGRHYSAIYILGSTQVNSKLTSYQPTPESMKNFLVLKILRLFFFSGVCWIRNSEHLGLVLKEAWLVTAGGFKVVDDSFVVFMGRNCILDSWLLIVDEMKSL